MRNSTRIVILILIMSFGFSMNASALTPPDLEETINRISLSSSSLISSLESRNDFESAQLGNVKLLRELQKKLQLLGANVKSPKQNELSEFIAIKVLPMLNALYESNAKITKMGQLDPQRVITPSEAISENRTIELLKTNINELKSILSPH